MTPQELRALRQRLGCSRRQLAGWVAVTPQTVGNWERGRYAPTGPAEALLRLIAGYVELAGKRKLHRSRIAALIFGGPPPVHP